VRTGWNEKRRKENIAMKKRKKDKKAIKHGHDI
jgi:hypothetical protein